jgi:hypothetical protein
VRRLAEQKKDFIISQVERPTLHPAGMFRQTLYFKKRCAIREFSGGVLPGSGSACAGDPAVAGYAPFKSAPCQDQDIVAGTRVFRYIMRVKGLTKHEQLVLCVVVGLLLTGWAVKTWRAAHPPPAAAAEKAKP